MRVDRNGSQLAFLTITLPEERRHPRDYEFLAEILNRRLRSTDTAGFLADGRIGVILPDTPKSGAWKVASDICQSYEVGRHRPDCEVHVYPADPPELEHESDGRGEQEGSPSEPAPVGDEFDACLASRESAWKRLLDIVGATFGLVLSAPIMVIAGILIKLTSSGPVFFSQEREGLGGHRFRIYKLRTMSEGADHQQESLRSFSSQDGPAFKMADDPRVTKVGYWLRVTSLDEIPQFWNVLRGEMSLVGPRPLPTAESLSCAAWQRRRLVVKPGMTCIWQVRGRNSVPFDEWVRMDLQYVESRSLWCDLRLLLLTIPSLLAQKGPR